MPLALLVGAAQVRFTADGAADAAVMVGAPGALAVTGADWALGAEVPLALVAATVYR